MQRVDENKVWEACGFGSFADAIGEQEAGGAEAGKTPQRSRIRQGDQTVGCMLICVCARCLHLCCFDHLQNEHFKTTSGYIFFKSSTWGVCVFRLR